MFEEFERRLDEICGKIFLSLSVVQKRQFLEYYERLIEKNKVMNLTAITEMDDVILKHFIDSILLVKALPDINTLPYSCIDVGTGAGFPGIPLKIVFPQLKIVLLDSLNKRVGFLKEIVEALKLSDVQAIHGRAEDYGRKEEYREQFDLCFSRAVANLATLSEYCIPFVKKGGFFISYKSAKAEEEMQGAREAVRRLGGEMQPAVSLYLPGTDVERCFVSVKKLWITPKKYPRKAGMPLKEPLKGNVGEKKSET